MYVQIQDEHGERECGQGRVRPTYHGDRYGRFTDLNLCSAEDKFEALPMFI
jgi:hypothetical protein